MSMTGFGRGEAQRDDVFVTADIRSVNHRFLDVHVRCPAKFLSWENRVRGLVRDALKRGKVDVFLNVREWGKSGTAVRVNRPLLESFLAEVSRLREEQSLRMDLSLRDLMGVPDLFAFAPEGADPVEEYWQLAEGAVKNAIAMLQDSRREEGERMRAVIGETLGRLREMGERIASLSAENKTLATERFKERIQAVSGETGVDPARLAQEAAYLLDRLDITEEVDRLRSHLTGLDKLLSPGAEAVGKRFDFLVQEVFRELTTASNKSAHTGISELCVSARTELEKIREQIQNVE